MRKLIEASLFADILSQLEPGTHVECNTVGNLLLTDSSDASIGFIDMLNGDIELWIDNE